MPAADRREISGQKEAGQSFKPETSCFHETVLDRDYAADSLLDGILAPKNYKNMKLINTLLLLVISCVFVHATDIDRKTFSLSLPDKWTENTKDDMYSPDSFIFFEGPESTFFAVIIGQKSAGASVEALVNKQRDVFTKKFTDATITVITQWSSSDGRGYKIEGKIQGIMSARITIFGFEKGDNVCLVEEYATIGDYKTYASDFDKLRQTFKLK